MGRWYRWPDTLGIRSKSAVGITSLSEGLTCLVGVISYICLNGFNFNYHLGLALLIGALLSIPVSVNLVALIRENILEDYIINCHH